MDMKLDFLRFSVRPNWSLVPCTLTGVYDWFVEIFPEFKDPLLVQDCEVWSHFQYYDFCLSCANNVLIAYDDGTKVKGNKGINISIPSSGLWIIDKLFHCNDPVAFFQLLRKRSKRHQFGLKFTRLDICFDDFDYRLDGHYKSASELFPMLHRVISKTQYRSCFESLDQEVEPESKDALDLLTDQNCSIGGIGAMGGRSMGWTFYLGRRSGGRVLRIYDKYAESDRKRRKYLQYHPGDFENAPVFVDSVRYEFEILSLFADALVDRIISSREKGFSYQFSDFVDSWFRFSSRDLDYVNNHQSRDFVEDPKWRAFVQNNSSLTQSFDKPELFDHVKRNQTYSSSETWLCKAVLPYLSAHYLIHGDLSFLQGLIKQVIRDDMVPDKYKKMVAEVTRSSFEKRVFDVSGVNLRSNNPDDEWMFVPDSDPDDILSAFSS